MTTRRQVTLGQYLLERLDTADAEQADLHTLLTDVALGCKAVAQRIAMGALAPAVDASQAPTPGGPSSPEQVSHEIIVRAAEWRGNVAAMSSKCHELPYVVPRRGTRGRFLLCFDPLDGSVNVDVNVTVGSVFSILRAPAVDRDPTVDDFLQCGTRQVCAGYAVYGPSTMLLLTVGRGTHGFTLDHALGEWVLSHESIRVPDGTHEFAINASNSRYWPLAVRRYVDECLAGATGPRHAEFTMRWIASLVAEAHRILMRGGVFLYPRDSRDPSRPGRLRLLYEANPIAFLIEQAGGAASTGEERVCDLLPSALRQRVGLIFGAADEVRRIERYHREDPRDAFASPLFGRRGLFASTD